MRVPVPDIAPGMPGNKHFPDGVLIPKIVADDVTDIINVPKPPGRHALMGCAGVSGAMKNHIGLLAGSRPGADAARPARPRAGPQRRQADGPTWATSSSRAGDKINDPNLSRADKAALLKQLAGRRTKWDLNNENGPNMMLHEKIAELTSVFAAKERFTVADMRRTVSSVGPDIGDTMDIGKVIASRTPPPSTSSPTALMKNAYDAPGRAERTRQAPPAVAAGSRAPPTGSQTAIPNGDTPSEYFYGKTWLEKGATAFDTLQIRAAMAYGLSPTGMDGIKMQTFPRPGESKDDAFERMETPK